MSSLKRIGRNKIDPYEWVVLRTIHFSTTVLIITFIMFLVFQARIADARSNNVLTIEEKYPGLATGVLKSAKLAELTPGIILKGENLEIRESELKEKIAGAEPKIREQLQKNLFFLLEQEATMKILVYEARNSVRNKEGLSDSEVLKNHLNRISQQVSVSETEVKAFYEVNKEMVGGMPFDHVKDSINEFLLKQKRAETIDDYITGLGDRNTIEVNQTWAKAQYHKARDNPVDRARMSGKPTMVEFGATGCIPCDMMQPILDKLRKKYPDSLNVVFVHVREEQILAARFGIRSIPVQVFFDRNGKEVFRHKGYFPEKEVHKQLTQMGIR
ncbi:MAG: thioredoxin family protein [Desulfobacterales bacterium]|nr:MAG: thioredoxin family protein [Desulfobacterales bacterium]